jgi:hypothetical protein
MWRVETLRWPKENGRNKEVSKKKRRRRKNMTNPHNKII